LGEKTLKTLHDAVVAGDLKRIQELVDQGHCINTVDSSGNTPLMIAARESNVRMVYFFLKQDNINLHHQNKNGDIALNLASRNSHIKKRLVIQHVTQEKVVEAGEDENYLVLVYKLITSLLYKSQRHSWDSRSCNNLRFYLMNLNEGFSDYSKQEFENYIRRQETDTGEFYGSYLSDDSDSDEETGYQQLSENETKRHDRKALKYQTRGQYNRLFYKIKVEGKNQGDLKDINCSSAVFNLPQRTTIHYGKRVNKAQLERDLQALNTMIDRGFSLQEAQRQSASTFYLAQYRGLIHLTSKWNQSSRRQHRRSDEAGKAQFSAAVLKAEALDLYKDYSNAQQQMEERQNSLLQKARALQEILLTLREPHPCTYNKYSYINFAYLLQNIYTQDYDEFHRLLNEDPLLKSILFNDANPFVSTGDVPYHALKYAYGIKPYKGHEGERLRPRWEKNGKAERPYSGVTYVSLHPLEDYEQDGPLHLISLNRNAEIKLESELNIIAERESCFPSYMPENRVFHKHVAKYPSFAGPYKQIYNYKYGMTKGFYEKLQALFAHARPHSNEMTALKKTLGEWLCSYHEVRLIDLARKKAERQGGVLIYRDINGRFSMVPPIDSINRNTASMTTELKKPIKDKQQLRTDLAANSKKDIVLLTREADIKSIKDTAYPRHTDADDFFALNENNSRLGMGFFMALNALRKKRYLALEQCLKNPTMIADINQTVDNGRLKKASLLHLLVMDGDLQALPLLLNCNNLQIQFSDQTPVDYPCNARIYEHISALALAIIDNKHSLFLILLQSLRFDLKETFSYVINNNPQVKNVSLMHLAVTHGSLDSVCQLLAAGLPANIKDSHHYTPLDEALFQKKYGIAKALVDAGADMARSLNLDHFPKASREYVMENHQNLQAPSKDIPKDIYHLLVAMKEKGLLKPVLSIGGSSASFFAEQCVQAETVIESVKPKNNIAKWL